MKKIFVLFLLLGCLGAAPSFAIESPQEKLDSIGFKILNANELDKRIIFSYNEKKKKALLEPEIYKRQIVITNDELAHCSNDDEIAAIIARRVFYAVKSYDGAFSGLMGTFEAAASPKKYETTADKKAVEYLIKAGYNPLGLITYINKTYPQKRQDFFSRHNLTSKRLMYIYEYLYINYPYFIVHNEDYIKNEYYQNFLLSSEDNRRKLHNSRKVGDYSRIDYE